MKSKKHWSYWIQLSGWFFAFNALLTLLFYNAVIGIIGLIISGVVILAGKEFEKEAKSTRKNPKAMEILKERYARGKLSKEKYEEMKLELEK